MDDRVKQTAPKMGSLLASQKKADEVFIDGRYRLLRSIGEGTSGTVFEADQLSVDRRVAIKILKPANYQNDDFRERFEREAKAIARLGHTNCISLYDFGHAEEFDSLYMVMELVQGVELFELIQDRPLPFVRALRISIQIAEALAHAHRRGILHRDLKPENVIVNENDDVKVLDFGLARMLDLFADDSGRRLTADGAIFGTPAYMSPEQCGAEESVTVQSDIYSLGVMLYQLFEGRLPFDSKQVVAILIKHRSEPPPPMEADIPERLKALIFKMLEKEKSKRPTTATAVADILRATLLRIAMKDDHLPANITQEIELASLGSLDDSRELVSDFGSDMQRSSDYAASLRQSGRHRAVRHLIAGRGKTENLVDQHLGGRYRLLSEFGRGAMSTVFSAQDVKTGQTVAVKVLSGDVPEEFQAPERFAREVATLDGLRHPNLVQMLDHGFDLTLDRHFIVMSMAEGDTLDRLSTNARTSLELSLTVAIDVASALEYAHDSGVIHRDLKPSNIILVPGPDGAVSCRVLDFGLALLIADQRRLTEHGKIPGTVGFFAPEQLRGDPATTSVDVYALGVVLYRALSGHQPYDGRTNVEVATAVLRGDAPALSTFVQEVPEELSDLVERMMSGNPAARPSAAQVLETLSKISADVGVSRFKVQHQGRSANPREDWRLRRPVFPPDAKVRHPTPNAVPAVSSAQQTPGRPIQWTGQHQPMKQEEIRVVRTAPPKKSSTPFVLMALIALLLVALLGLGLFYGLGQLR